MAEMPGIVVTGASGRMGRMVLRAVAESTEVRLVGAIVRSGHPWMGTDVGLAMGGTALGVLVEDDPLDAFARAQGVIDFTTPEASVVYAGLAAQARAVHVIGTTGLLPPHLARIEAASRHAVIVRSGNMSLGVALLSALTRRAAAVLGEGWDAEIVEAHHSAKRDAPSGTALILGKAVAQGRGVDLAAVSETARAGVREPGAIGFASVRGGDIVGEHDVVFAGLGERVVLRHIATDRAIFTRGALRAVVWGQDKAPGEYGMDDVLGLNVWT